MLTKKNGKNIFNSLISFPTLEPICQTNTSSSTVETATNKQLQPVVVRLDPLSSLGKSLYTQWHTGWVRDWSITFKILKNTKICENSVILHIHKNGDSLCTFDFFY